jgi:hypothetical protein
VVVGFSSSTSDIRPVFIGHFLGVRKLDRTNRREMR